MLMQHQELDAQFPSKLRSRLNFSPHPPSSVPASIIDKNIKSANILLDSELNPHLSDSGLASFIPNVDQSIDYNVSFSRLNSFASSSSFIISVQVFCMQLLNNNAGSGYSAPKVAMSGQYTLKSDDYGFGVVMLELLTGCNPFDSSRPRTEQSFVRWATPQLHDTDALAKLKYLS
ncbi:hypothetical protein Dsin_014620 [Dipteronia sinensis]|uniref:Protein kinase domain-containing protein n=1 Tax=Dipteronia sinensis TaxID=43782 RepID=A0AAE0AN84_9ROSI|nr:hypothetical protein Dsin_014620 [Dipteronia sinensis]